MKVPAEVVFNFDGFHTADVHHNAFHGFVDVKLHGHNHADCFTCAVHDHGDEAEFPEAGTHAHGFAGDPAADALGFRSRHSVRYTSLLFRDNEIDVDDGPALRYRDTPHAADDRTANSEPNPHLKDPHVHFVDVTIARNRLRGGGFEVQVFNSEDENHPAQNRGILRFVDNELAVAYGGDPLFLSSERVDAIRILKADGLELRLRGNAVTWEPRDDPAPGLGDLPGAGGGPERTGIRLDRVDHANLTLERNRVEGGAYGVFAHRLSESVAWRLLGNEFATAHSWRGQDVENAPEES
jgi:hypothetical protein